jgi:hypothetical protein
MCVCVLMRCDCNHPPLSLCALLQEEGMDMVGMGPYIVQRRTPVGEAWLAEHGPDHESSDVYKAWAFDMTSRMISLTRVTLGNVNLAAATAVQAAHPGALAVLECGVNMNVNMNMNHTPCVCGESVYQMVTHSLSLQPGVRLS